MKKAIAAIFSTALMLSATPALAHGGHGHGHGGAIAGAIIGGVVLGHVLSHPHHPYPPYPPYPPGPPPAALGNCQPTTGVGLLNGRQAEFGGTMCFDAYGNGYVLPQSQHFIRYLP